jgi:hypothetical protein
MQVDQPRNRQFLETVAAQQDQLHQRAHWIESLQAAQSSSAQVEAVFRPENARLAPMARQAANAFGDIIPGNIVILENSDDNELQWFSPRSGT